MTRTRPESPRAASADVPDPAPGGTRRRWSVLGAALAASWALPLLLDALALDVVLIPVLVLAIASLMRVGGGLLDRIVVAAFVLCGAVMSFGLLFSVWPWGLAPVPGAGLLLSVVSLAGWLSGRRPRIPLRLRGSDALVAGTAAVVWHYMHHPLIGKSVTERLALFITSEDRLGHFSYFDGIHHVGGYAFLHQEAARTYMMTPSEAVYPQGTHFLLAWIDVLVKSSTDGGPGVEMMNRYLLYVIGGYALLCAALVWAARWIGGPRLRGWRAAAVCATVMAVMLSGSMAELVERGFDSETAGLLFLTVGLALLVRPAMGRAEFAVVAVAALVAVTFVYNLYGALIGLALAAVLIVHRRRFARRRIPLLVFLAAGAVVAGLPSLFSVLTKLDVSKTSNLPGPMVVPDRPVLIGCALLAVLAASLPANRKTGTGRMVLALVLGAATVIGLFGAWQKHTIGHFSYYFEKLAAAGLVIALISLGLVGLALLPAARTARGSVWSRRGGTLLRSGLATAAALALFGNVQFGVPSGWSHPSAWYGNPMLLWAKGGPKTDLGPATEALAGRDLDRAAPPLIALYSNDPYMNLQSTFLAQLLTHRAGDMVGLYETVRVKTGGPADEKDAAKDRDAARDYAPSLEHLKKAIASCATPPTVLVADRAVADRLRADLERDGVRATVLHAPVD
ncbi:MULTISPECIES: hypothetical protein [unclassified Streptomyces]|uniref:hypothetical protein n=1 Tax=unclassified Streptomyces TaxID=2593676 RepID=UPI0013A6DF8C|nr:MULTISPECIES: hypothetical protein [unclassified Streptomyces]